MRGSPFKSTIGCCATFQVSVRSTLATLAVVRVIRDTNETPVMIGVRGDRGAGKSSVLNMTQVAVAGEARTVCLGVNGWTFEVFEDAKTVVMETGFADLRRAR